MGALQPIQQEKAPSSSVKMERIVILAVGVVHAHIMVVKRIRKKRVGLPSFSFFSELFLVNFLVFFNELRGIFEEFLFYEFYG